MRFAIIALAASIPVTTFANSLDCSKVQYCVDHLAQADSAFPTSVNNQITDDKPSPLVEDARHAFAADPVPATDVDVD